MEKDDIVNVNTETGDIFKSNTHKYSNKIMFKYHDYPYYMLPKSFLVNRQQLIDLYADKNTSNARKVYNWTKNTGSLIADKPQAMTREEVQFIINMATSELVELAQTVADDADDAIKMVQLGAHVDVSLDYKKPETELGIISEQADAAVDVMYYLYNTYAKKGVNLDSVFEKVHAANEAKRFNDGTFHRRNDGKVLKPPGWQEPDINGEIERQSSFKGF